MEISSPTSQGEDFSNAASKELLTAYNVSLFDVVKKKKLEFDWLQPILMNFSYFL